MSLNANVILARILTTFFVAAFFSTIATAEPPSKVKVGALLPVSGQFARIGDLVQRGLISGVTDNIELLVEDENCSAVQAVTAFKALYARGVRLVIGPCCGSPQTALAPILKPLDAFSLLISSAPRSVFEESAGKMFSVQFAIEDEATFVAQSISQRGIKKVVMLFVDNDFSRTHEAEFKRQFKGEVIETLTYTNGDIAAMRAALLKIRKLDPDALFIPDVSPFLLGLKKELKIMGYEKLPVYSIYAAKSPDVIDVNGAAADGLIISYPDIGEEDALLYYPKLGGVLISRASERCGNDTECVRKFLRSNYNFDSFGVLQSVFRLKEVQQGKFVDLPRIKINKDLNL